MNVILLKNKNKQMSYLINNQQKITEIIFAGRNKSYGAYAIRSAYGNTIVRSLAIMLLSFGTLMATAFYLTHRNNNIDSEKTTLLDNTNDSTITVEMNIEKKIEPIKQPEPANQNNSASQAIATVISETASVNTNTVLNDVQGTGTGTLTDGPPSTPTTTGNDNTITITPTVTETYYVADSNPEYEGGLRALYAFLASKLKYPDNALESGKEGTVYVKFVVDQNGKVGNLSLLNSQGFGLDEEALRVVSIIPNFKTPGMVAGKAVKVYFQLPIKFKMK